ncbi:MAG: glycosyltransferase family 2 protein [Rickettsiales bacterium]
MATTSALRIGDILVAQGSIERELLEANAGAARGKLGEYLQAHGIIDSRALPRALATQQGVPFLDLTTRAPDAALFRPHDLLRYQARQFVPFAADADGMLVLATCDPSPELRVWARRYYNKPVRLVATGKRDLEQYFVTIAANASTRHARLDLRRQSRHLVADRVLTRPQMRGFALLFALFAAGFVAAPTNTWYLLLVTCNLFYLTTLAVKWQLYAQGRAAQYNEDRLNESLQLKARALEADDLPVYSILVPLYHESAQVMGRLITSLNALDYPREKLDIKLIVEADDVATHDALKALRPPATMEIIAVPPSHPRTKPKACNVALQRIRGEYLVIYDAEDAPAPDQLKLAVALFAQSSPQTACLQAPLNYYNRNENVLTQLFAIEYSALFRLMLPALSRMNLPVPLGGTSNHLRVAILRDAGGWDAFNVTEDADLGIRLSYLGYRTRILPSLTLEEAPITLGVWMRQRSRWIKGYIQTWLVYMRDVPELKRRLGGPAYYGFQFFVGAPALTFLLAPLFWGIFILSSVGLLPMHLPPAMLGLCLVSFAGGILSHWLYARAVTAREGWTDMRAALLLYPLYWLLHSVAAARALWQLARRPHFWEKTCHGLSGLQNPEKNGG